MTRFSTFEDLIELNYYELANSFSCDLSRYTMDSISILNNSTKLFQFCGLQCFSLNSLNEQKSRKYPPSNRVIILILSFTIIGISYGSFFYTTDATRTELESAAKNNLIDITRLALEILQLLAFALSLTLSFFKNRHFVIFFKDAKEISNIFSSDLNYKISYSKLKKHLWLILVISLSPLLSFFTFNLFKYFQNSSDDNIQPQRLVYFLPLIFHRLLFARFYYFVAILNHHLEALVVVVSRKIPIDAVRRDFVEIPTLKDFERKNFREIRAFTRVYLLIKEMARQVNDSMGFILLVLILMFVIESTRFGYQTFMYIFGFKLNITRKKSAMWRL